MDTLKKYYKKCRLCNNRVKGRGLCAKHHSEFWKLTYRTLKKYEKEYEIEIPIEPKQKMCLYKDCDSPVLARGLCAKHYCQLYNVGNLIAAYYIPSLLLCGIKGCGRRHYARGFCRKHYIQALKGKIRPLITGCKVNECDGKHYAKGFCNKHYQAYRKDNEL